MEVPIYILHSYAVLRNDKVVVEHSGVAGRRFDQQFVVTPARTTVLIALERNICSSRVSTKALKRCFGTTSSSATGSMPSTNRAPHVPGLHTST